MDDDLKADRDLQLRNGGGGAAPQDRPKGEGLLEDPRHLRRDARMVERAKRLGWKIPAKLKGKIVDRLETALDIAESARDISRVADTFAKLNAQNIVIEKAEEEAQKVPAGGTTVNILNAYQTDPRIQAAMTGMSDEQLALLEHTISILAGEPSRVPAGDPAGTPPTPQGVAPVQSGGLLQAFLPGAETGQ